MISLGCPQDSHRLPTRFPKDCNRICIGFPQDSPNRFICRGSDGVGLRGCYGPVPAPFAKTADNFCAQARYFVHVTFATLRRNRSVAHFRQKNTYEFVRFSFQDWSGSPVASRELGDAFWEPPEGLLSDQIWAKMQFLQNGHVSKFQKCLFIRNKSPCGSNLT